jgi:hypothetical protein
MNVTYHAVVAFDRDEAGDLNPGKPRKAADAAAAVRYARAWSSRHAGAVAFSRTGDPVTGVFEDAAILAQFGSVDLDAVCEA